MTPEDGKNKIHEDLKAWSEILTTHSLHSTYAIIAANWAVHIRTDKILTNNLALLSIGLCVGLISANILISWIITELQRRLWQKAEDNPGWWRKEYEKYLSQITEWPYTKCIQNVALILRFLKVSIPILAGILFIFSLYNGQTP